MDGSWEMEVGICWLFTTEVEGRTQRVRRDVKSASKGWIDAGFVRARYAQGFEVGWEKWKG